MNATGSTKTWSVRERLAARDPTNTTWQADLSDAHTNIGNVLVERDKLDEALKSSRASLAIDERLAASDPSNATWLRDLSVTYLAIGDVLDEQGKLDEALRTYRAGLAIDDKRAKADPDNNDRQYDQAALGWPPAILLPKPDSLLFWPRSGRPTGR